MTNERAEIKLESVKSRDLEAWRWEVWIDGERLSEGMVASPWVALNCARLFLLDWFGSVDAEAT